MGAFGENTMSFEQWMQFVLIPRLREIVRDRAEFPPASALAVYAVRAFDGDDEAEDVRDVLYEMDRLVDRVNGASGTRRPTRTPAPSVSMPSIVLGDTRLPAVAHSLLDVLPQFEGEDLESQLQTFDTFLAICAPTVRPELSALLMAAAARTTNAASRARIEAAAQAVARGDRAAEPYDHDAAMKKYREEHCRSFKRGTKPP